MAFTALTIGVVEPDLIHLLHAVDHTLIEEVGVSAGNPVKVEAVLLLNLQFFNELLVALEASTLSRAISEAMGGAEDPT